MALRQLSEPTVEPVTLAELKLHIRVSTTSTVEDSLLNAMEKAARVVGENITRRAFTPRPYELTYDEFPSGGITLPFAPLSASATDISITYVDSSGNNQTLGATHYTIDYKSEPGYIACSSNNEWPDTYEQLNAVSVFYSAGYPLNGTDPTTPEPIKAWIKLRVASMYAYRESMNPGVLVSLKDLPRSHLDGLLDPYILPSVP